MNILLTGATGFIGSSVRQELAAGHMVNAVARRIPGHAEEGVGWIESDLADPKQLAASLPESMDAVVHLAQSKGYRNFPTEAADIFDVNVSSTLALLEYARKSGAKTFIFASTASIYRQSAAPQREDSLVEPASFYARSKRMAEMLVESYAGFFRCVILRFFTVYGPGQKDMLIPTLIDKVRAGAPLQVQGKEGLTLSPVYVDDVSRVVAACLESEASSGVEIFNVGGPERLSIRRMGTTIGAVLGSEPKFEFTEGAEPGGWTTEPTALHETFGLTGIRTFVEGIRKTVSSV